MCGSTRSTTSPSSSSTSRSTPCAAGCCGPKLMVKLRRFSAIALPFRLPFGRSEGREHFRARHVVGLVGEVVIAGLLVDEHLTRQRIARSVVECLRRHVVIILANQPIEQWRAALLAETTLGPFRRA